MIGVAGLPVVTALVWVYDVSSGGLRHTEPDLARQGPAARFRLLKILGFLLSLAAALAFGWLVLG